MGKQKDNLVIILLLVGVLFFWISFVSFLSNSLKWEHIFAGACSLAGGLLTVIGVQMTIHAQREQESLKLIPSKIVALHKLSRAIKEFKSEFEDMVKDVHNNFMNNLGGQYTNKESGNVYEISLGFVSYFLLNYKENLYNKEIEFVELAAQIDIEVYGELKDLFEEIEREIMELISEEGWSYPNSEDTSEEAIRLLKNAIIMCQLHVITKLVEFNIYLEKEKINEYGNMNYI